MFLSRCSFGRYGVFSKPLTIATSDSLETFPLFENTQIHHQSSESGERVILDLPEEVSLTALSRTKNKTKQKTGSDAETQEGMCQTGPSGGAERKLADSPLGVVV